MKKKFFKCSFERLFFIKNKKNVSVFTETIDNLHFFSIFNTFFLVFFFAPLPQAKGAEREKEMNCY